MIVEELLLIKTPTLVESLISPTTYNSKLSLHPEGWGSLESAVTSQGLKANSPEFRRNILKQKDFDLKVKLGPLYKGEFLEDLEGPELADNYIRNLCVNVKGAQRDYNSDREEYKINNIILPIKDEEGGTMLLEEEVTKDVALSHIQRTKDASERIKRYIYSFWKTSVLSGVHVFSMARAWAIATGHKPPEMPFEQVLPNRAYLSERNAYILRCDTKGNPIQNFLEGKNKGKKVVDYLNGNISSGDPFTKSVWFDLRDFIRLCANMGINLASEDPMLFTAEMAEEIKNVTLRPTSDYLRIKKQMVAHELRTASINAYGKETTDDSVSSSELRYAWMSIVDDYLMQGRDRSLLPTMGYIAEKVDALLNIESESMRKPATLAVERTLGQSAKISAEDILKFKFDKGFLCDQEGRLITFDMGYVMQDRVNCYGYYHISNNIVKVPSEYNLNSASIFEVSSMLYKLRRMLANKHLLGTSRPSEYFTVWKGVYL